MDIARPAQNRIQQYKAVADLLGHSSISVTGDVYGHTSDDAARAAIEGLTVGTRPMTSNPQRLRPPRWKLALAHRQISAMTTAILLGIVVVASVALTVWLV